MTDWPVKTLGDLMTVQNGFAFDSQYFSPSGKIGLIRIRDLKGGFGTETQFVGSYDDEYVVTAGDYLIGMDGEFRCYEWKGDPALLNQRVCRLRNFGKSLDARFLFHGINKFLKEIEDVTGYTTVKHLSSKSILAIEMPVPPLEEQKRIVALLDAATAHVTELTACYEQARTHANNLFTSASREAFESNPDWPVKTIGDVCAVLDSLRKPITKRDRISGDYPYYGATGIVDYVGDYIFDERLVLVGEDGAKWDAGDRTAFIAEGKYWVNNHAHVLRCKPGVLVDSWLTHYLTMSDLNRYVSGLTVPKLNQGSLVSIAIPVPPLEEQERIVGHLDSMKAKTSEMVAAYDAKLTAAKNLRQSFLESAFAGEL
jgi:type I restriction enzyme, S subunit